MKKGYSFMKVGIVFLAVIFILPLLSANLFASEDYVVEAIQYRIKGYVYQRHGDFNNAIQNYKKAIERNPFYACVHNDLGILYEQKGWFRKAEQEYLKAVSIDSRYTSAYTNLALLNERKGDIEAAFFYWDKRIKFGDPADPWTLTAKNRLFDLSRQIEDKKQQKLKQKEAWELRQKEQQKQKDKELKEQQLKEQQRQQEKLLKQQQELKAKEFKEQEKQKEIELKQRSKQAEKEIKQPQPAMQLPKKEVKAAAPVLAGPQKSIVEAGDLAKQLAMEKNSQRIEAAKREELRQRYQKTCQKYVEKANKLANKGKYDAAIKWYKETKKLISDYPDIDFMIKESERLQDEQAQKKNIQKAVSPSCKAATIPQKGLKTQEQLKLTVLTDTKSRQEQLEDEQRLNENRDLNEKRVKAQKQQALDTESKIIALQGQQDKNKKKIELLLNKAEDYIAAHKYDSAIEEYQKIERLDPGYADLKKLKEEALRAKARYEIDRQAKQQQEKYIRQADRQANESQKMERQIIDYLDKAESYLSKSRYDSAIACYNNIAKLDPNYPGLESLIDNAKDSKVKLERLKDKGSQKSNIQPKTNIQPIITPRPAQPELEREQDALKQVNKYYTKGQSYYLAGRYQEAQRQLEMTLAIDPEHTEANRLLRYCQRRTQKGYYRPLQQAISEGKGAATTEITPVPEPLQVSTQEVIKKEQPQVIEDRIAGEVAKEDRSASMYSGADLDKKYIVLGTVAYRSELNDIDKLNEELLEKAKAMGAEEVVSVRYFQHNGFTYGYGTAVKKRR